MRENALIRSRKCWSEKKSSTPNQENHLIKECHMKNECERIEAFCEQELEGIEDLYREKPTTFETWAGYTVKESYTPEDIGGLSYEHDLSDPGCYPYTRGIYPNMYRGRLWSRRELCGFGSPEATNQRIRYLVGQGESP